jgi:hypothetical protein
MTIKAARNPSQPKPTQYVLRKNPPTVHIMTITTVIKMLIISLFLAWAMPRV